MLVGRDADEAADLARRALDRDVDELVVVGGDGMVHLGLQLVGGRPVTFGVVPAGTGNDFARALGLPRRDPVAATRVVLDGAVRAVDLGRSEGCWFGCVAAAGFDARVNDRANRMRRLRGRSRYDLAMLLELGVFRPVPYVVEADGVTWETAAMLVAVANAPSYGGGMQVSPHARLDDGLLDLLVVHPLSKAAFLRVFPRVYRGTHLTHPAVEIRRVASVRLVAPDITVYADGERVGPLPRTFEAVPRALRVRAPAAVGGSR